MLVAQPIDTISDFGASLFILLVVIAGSVAAGFFLARPLRRRRASRLRRDADELWSTTATDHASRADDGEESLSAATPSPWSTSEHGDDQLQDTR